MGDVLIPGLRMGDCTDCVCVRVSRFWEFYDVSDETKLLHGDLVLIDEEGNSIHAQIYPNVYERFKTLIKEGSVYNFECFRVRKSNHKYKPVANEFMLSFSKWTTIEEVVEVPPAFPTITYRLTSIEQVPSRLERTEYFTDVIGIVTAISNITTLRTRGRQSDSSKRVVTICSASNASVNVVLWGERATSFPAEEVHKDGQASPQVVIFVGTLVKNYSGVISVSGSSPCKWYINPEVPEAKALMASIGNMHQPIKWDQHMAPTRATSAAEPKKVSDIRDLNPFKNKKIEFLVTMTIRKIDSSWWCNSCEKCQRTTKPYGDLYKCTEPRCGTIGKPNQRYKLSIVAGDETGDTNFIMFGRWVQRLTKKSADTLIAENPQGFIPNEITRLLEKAFIWNGAGSSMQGTPQKSAALPLLSPPTASEASHASSATPTKKTVNIPELPVTPQSRRCTNEDEITPKKGAELTLPLAEEDTEHISALATLTQDKATMSPGKDDTTLAKSTGNPGISKDVAGNSATKTQKSAARKRPRNSPNKKIAKKLLLDEVTGSKDDGSADYTTKP